MVILLQTQHWPSQLPQQCDQACAIFNMKIHKMYVFVILSVPQWRDAADNSRQLYKTSYCWRVFPSLCGRPFISRFMRILSPGSKLPTAVSVYFRSTLCTVSLLLLQAVTSTPAFSGSHQAHSLNHQSIQPRQVVALKDRDPAMKPQRWRILGGQVTPTGLSLGW